MNQDKNKDKRKSSGEGEFSELEESRMEHPPVKREENGSEHRESDQPINRESNQSEGAGLDDQKS